MCVQWDIKLKINLPTYPFMVMHTYWPWHRKTTNSKNPKLIQTQLFTIAHLLLMKVTFYNCWIAVVLRKVEGVNFIEFFWSF